MSVSPPIHLSVRVEKLGSHWTDFHEIWYVSIFRKSVEKIQVSLKSNKNNGYFKWRIMYIYDQSRHNSIPKNLESLLSILILFNN